MTGAAEVYVSTGAFKTRSLRDILDSCRRLGISHIELSSRLEFAPDNLDLVRRYHQRPFTYLVHNYFPPPADSFVLNLASSNDELLRRSYELCTGAIDLCAELGAPFYSVHAGAAVDPRPEDLGKSVTHLKRGSLDRAYDTFVSSVRTLADYAAGQGVKLIIENHVVNSFNLVDGKNVMLLGATAPDLTALISDIGRPNVGLLVDIGHLNVTAQSLGFDRYEFIERVAPWVEAFQLNDNDGSLDTDEAFDGSAWFIDVLRQFRQATLIVEASKLDDSEILSCRQALIDALESKG